MDLQQVKAKAQTLSPSQAIRLTAEPVSYWLMNIRGKQIVGFYKDSDDRPERHFFGDMKRVFSLETSSGEFNYQYL